MNKFILIMLTLFVSTFSVYGKELNIGWVMAGPDIYYKTSAETFKKLAAKKGWKVTITNAEYDGKKLLANVENLVSKGVDAIVLVALTPDVAARCAKKAKKGGVPIFLNTTAPNPIAYDIPVGIVNGEWDDYGKLVGVPAGKKFKGKKVRVGLIEGYLGMGIAESMTKGFIQGIKQNANPEIIFQQSGKWARKGGMEQAQNLINSGKKIDVMFVQNEEMCAGVLQAYKEAGKKVDFELFTGNGKEMAWEWIKQGKITGTAANPPTGEGDLVFQMVNAHFSKKPFPRHVFMHTYYLDKSNVSKAIPWNIDTYFAQKASGKIEMDLSKRVVGTKK